MKLTKPIAVGNTADVYLWDDLAVKVYKKDVPLREVESEAKRQMLALKYGIYVPKVFDVKKINGKPALVMEYIKGSTLGDLLKKQPEKIEYFLAKSIDIQMSIHSIQVSSLKSMRDKLNRQISTTKILDPNTKDYILNRLDKQSFDNQFCHGDFHLFNLIQTDLGVAVIDWVDASAGDPLADVCRSYLLYYFFSKVLAEKYINLYCEKSGVRKEEILTWAPILAAARLSEQVKGENKEDLLKIIREGFKR